MTSQSMAPPGILPVVALNLATVFLSGCGDQTEFVEHGAFSTRAGDSEASATTASDDGADANAKAYPETLDELRRYMEEDGAVAPVDSIESVGTTTEPMSGDDTDAGVEPPIALPNNPTELKTLCEAMENLRFEQTLTFADPGRTCAWNEAGNLSQVNGRIRARREQTATLQLPPGALLCEMNFAAREQAMRYDDEIFLLFDDVVLLSSFDYGERLPEAEGLQIFDWTRLRDTAYVQSRPEDLYCLGAAEGLGECYMPPTETSGTMRLTIAPELVRRLGFVDEADFEGANDEAAPSFTFVTTGDNDGSDCRHKDFSFEVTATYILPR